MLSSMWFITMAVQLVLQKIVFPGEALSVTIAGPEGTVVDF
jgi:hypothetical protein